MDCYLVYRITSRRLVTLEAHSICHRKTTRILGLWKMWLDSSLTSSTFQVEVCIQEFPLFFAEWRLVPLFVWYIVRGLLALVLQWSKSQTVTQTSKLCGGRAKAMPSFIKRKICLPCPINSMFTACRCQLGRTSYTVHLKKSINRSCTIWPSDWYVLGLGVPKNFQNS